MLDLYRLATALKEVKEPSRQTKWAFSAVIDGSNPPQTAWFSSLLNECPPGLSKLSTVHCAESQLLMSHGARFGVIAIIKAESDLVLGDADPSPDLGLQHQGPISGQCCDWTNQSEARCRVFSSPNKGSGDAIFIGPCLRVVFVTIRDKYLCETILHSSIAVL